MTAPTVGEQRSSNGRVGPPDAKRVEPAPAAMVVAARRRRRPGLALLGLALAATCGILAARAASAAGDRLPVLALSHDVAFGAPITAADLVVAKVARDPGLAPLSANERSRVVGEFASADLKAGTLLTAAMLTTQQMPGPGEALVPVTFRAGQLPASTLVAGERVQLVTTPQANTVDATSGSSTANGTVRPATVLKVGTAGSDGSTTVDLLVSQADAAGVAIDAAAGRLTLIVASGGGR